MKTSSQLHFGVEEEFALLYADGALANEVDAVLARVPDRYKPDRVKRDLHYCIVEVTTPVCDSPAAVERSLTELRRVVGEAAAALGLRVISSGVHPTAPMEQGKLVETPRFRRLIDGGALRGDGVHFGFHLHVSLDGPETRVGVVNRLRWHIPDLVAFSVNAPFYLGEYHDVKSVRLEYYDPVPTVGPPPVIEKFADWADVLKSFARCGVEGERDHYGDIRHRSSFPTLEVRVMDTQQAVAETVAAAAYVWSLVRHYLTILDDEFMPPMTEDELERNREAAWRQGLDGLFHLYGDAVPRADYIGHTLHHLLERAGDEGPYLERLAARVAAGETGADSQLTFLKSDRADGPALLAELERKFAEGI
ncbi:MAG TPA: YbdK family carboxylate-amine ligase [bacterium]|nr:YbdK family carboxylate-amine ligase [bacterium]